MIGKARALAINNMRGLICDRIFEDTELEGLPEKTVDRIIMSVLRILIESDVDLQETLDLIWRHPERVHEILSGKYKPE